jgi:hypothetical protein
MPRWAPLRRVLWLACSSVLLSAPLAHANPASTAADFDGDGRGDRVTFRSEEPLVVHVWLSATSTTHVIHSSQPLLGVVATDLDGDRRAELVASNQSSGLQIWTKKPKGFRAFRAKQLPSKPGLSRSGRRAFDDGPALPVTSDASTPLPPLLVMNGDATVAAGTATTEMPGAPRGPTSQPRVTPFAPRPPPISAI